MSEFNVTDYIEYFQDLAGRHKDINGFYIMDINEIETSIRNDLKYPAMVLVSITGGIDAGNEDNILNRPKSGFILIDHLEQVDDYAGEIAAMDKTFKICKQVMAKIKKDAECDGNILDIDITTIKYEMMGPVFDNDWGWLFSFDTLYSIGALAVEEEVWLEEPKADMSGHK
jgi:hypothetical protein